VLGLLLDLAGVRGGLVAGGVVITTLLTLGALAYRRRHAGDLSVATAPARQADFATAA
jgi:hypothetical protein